MSKKTFSITTWLLLMCGAFVIGVIVLSKRGDMPWLRPAAVPLVTIKKITPLYLTDVAFMPDNRKVMTVGEIGLAAWDVASGRRLSTPAVPTVLGQSIALSPDGRRYALEGNGVFGGFVTVQRVQRKVRTSAYSRNGQYTFKETKPFWAPLRLRLFKGRHISLWDVKTGALLRRLDLPDETPQRQSNISRILFSPNATHLLVTTLAFVDSNNDGDTEPVNTLYHWDLKTYRVETKTVKQVKDVVAKDDYYDDNRLAMTSDGGKLIYPEARHASTGQSQPANNTGALSTQLELRDELRGQSSILPNADFPGKVSVGGRWKRPEFSRDGRYVAAIYKTDGWGFALDGKDGTIHLWDLKLRKLLWRHYELKFNPEVLRFSPDGRKLAIGGADLSASVPYFPSKGKLIVLDVISGGRPYALSEETVQDRLQQTKLKQQEKINQRLGIQPAGGVAPQFLPGDDGYIRTLAFSHDGKLLAAGYANRSLKIWKVK